MKATFIKQPTGFRGHAELFELDEPMTGYDGDKFDHVVVSAVTPCINGVRDLPETFIFGADADGNVIDWLELDGSYRGGLDIDKALRDAGYEPQRG